MVLNPNKESLQTLIYFKPDSSHPSTRSGEGKGMRL
jgi:hypothetical protein